jgi:sugar lactone lactonase YvrE
MNGCENILPEKDSTGVYVSCLDGNIHYLSPGHDGNYQLKKSFKAGEAVMGLAMSDDGDLFAAISTVSLEEWFKTGAAINRVARDITSKEIITGNYPCMNGICIDGKGVLYFTSDTFNLLNPKGLVYKMLIKNGGTFDSPVPYVPNAGAANGLYYDANQDKIFLSNTLAGIFEFTPDNASLNEVYLKLRFMEACDDLCTDIGGNVWMTDPGQSTVKMFNPGTRRLLRFNILGIGQASSCRIRSENGIEMLYIAELKQSQQPMSDDYNGRGVLVVPAQSLIRLFEPSITKKRNQP